MNSLDSQPSIKKLQNDIQALSLVSWMLPKEKRENLKTMKSQMKHLIEMVSKYSMYFSDFGWCAYDSLSTEVMETAIKEFEISGIEAAEEVLTKYYTSDVKNTLQWLKGKSKEYQLRYELILKAFDDHFAGRYYASIPLFLIIMDGAVNDFTGSKGFSADSTSVDVWDCLVGADNGLDKIREMIIKPRKKTNTEPIDIPYRHGILHGRDLNYDNVKVSCKCVALMFAIADWIQLKNSELTRKEKYKKDTNPPPIRESLKHLSDNRVIREEISSWKQRNVIIGEHVPKCGNVLDFCGYGYLQRVVQLFSFWNEKNYGHLSQCFNDLFFENKEMKTRPAECRSRFSLYHLIAWEFIEVEERGCGLAKVTAHIIYQYENDNKTVDGEIIVYYSGSDKDTIALPWRNNGEWKVTVFNFI